MLALACPVACENRNVRLTPFSEQPSGALNLAVGGVTQSFHYRIEPPGSMHCCRQGW